VVGTRKVSHYGKRAAYFWSRFLAKNDQVVVSGLARGVDSVAHEATLAVRGKTIAVLGHGLDKIYPAENYSLAEAIVKAGGCLISEYPPGVPAYPSHFPERNRIVAGLSRATFVIEAPLKSGSLITAQFALDEGREVFCLPGPYDDKNFEGNHEWLSQGAIPLFSADKLSRHWGWDLKQKQRDFYEIWECLFGEKKEISLGEMYEIAIQQKGADVKEFFEGLERALKQGVIQELNSQVYAWVGVS
jgi:DNA processing protein